MWTEERILHWKRTGEQPSSVMVWAPEHTGLFLDHVAEDRLYALFHLVAFRGLRRGEACGQRWTDTNLDAGLLTVAKQLVVNGWEVYEDDPKTDAGARTIALDSDTVQALKQHRAQQDKDRETWGSAWAETEGFSPARTENCSTLPTSRGDSSSCTRRSAFGRSGSTTSVTVPRLWLTQQVLV